ncbi:Putative insecticidal toxin complex [Pseudomonas chlororaphis]|uniref:Insecticidal toxin complex n=1 Tax=Pseudomonas chlororaphis TaxID=587753 RepID=A0A3G7TPM8_9PSED|nr:RHS repeat-associated core domain-containing protein [Pseudomonas chlororaphis]AZE49074.1 Putative insecticidal toxin complex [Pseudomonas chlororaphis]
MTTIADASTAQRCQGTPTLSVVDNRGLAVRSVQYNRTTAENPLDELITQQTYSELGHLTTSIDPRLLAEQQLDPSVPPNFLYLTSLSGRELQVHSQDAGDRLALYDVEGGVVWQQDSRDQQLSRTFDTLHRLTSISEVSEGVSRVSERLIYADATASSEANQRGQLLQSYSPAGLTLTPSYSITGQPLSSQQQFLRDDILHSDWLGAESDWWEALTPDTYLTRWAYDALGQQVQLTDAQNNQQRQRFNIAGQLAASELLLAGQTTPKAVLQAIDYSAAGQVLHEEAGNGVVTDYVYEPQTQRLSSLTTTRPAQSGRAIQLQALTYQYDPIGNLLAINDAAKAIRYTRNQRVVPGNQYTYDALYQLCQACGRENANAGQQTQALPPAIVPLWQEAGELTNYTRTYTYDRANNLTAIQHVGLHPYTQQMLVASTSNRAVQQTLGLTPQDVDGFFDACGNLQQLTAGQPLTWDSRNQLLRTTQVLRSGSDDDCEVYWYDGAGQRATKLGTTLTSGTTRTQRVRYLPGLELRQTEQTPNEGGSMSVTERLQVIQFDAAGRLALRVLHWEQGQPESIDNDQYRYSLDDQLGSSLLEVDQQADILTWEEYFPFGGTAVWSARNESETQYKFVRYSGKERDATGLYYYGFRYYAPWLSRWLNPDPAGTIDGLNLFGMVGNNPTTFKDDSGNQKTGYIFSPFSNEDAVKMVIGDNAQRRLRGKMTRTIIFENQFREAEFLQNLEKLKADISSPINNAIFISGLLKRYGNNPDPTFDAIAEAVNDIRTYSIDSENNILPQLGPDTKLYIEGHGSAGSDTISADRCADGDRIAIYDVGGILSEGGLPKDYQDIRVLWCQSADTIQEAASGGGQLNVKKSASAQKFADILGELGFSNVEVTGYKGIGYYSGYTKDNHMRQRLPGDSIDTRRKDAKQIFKANLP